MKKYKCIICDKEFTAEEDAFKFNHALCSSECCNLYVEVTETRSSCAYDDYETIINDLQKLNSFRKSYRCKPFTSVDNLPDDYH